MSAIDALKDAWHNRQTLGEQNQARHLAAFLPAALEIQDTPPNPLARKLAWTLLLLIVIAVIWASFGQVNIVASAEGKIIPSSRVKQIQPLEKAVVGAILVKEGDYVNRGQALVELDTTATQADQQRLASDLHSTTMRLAVNQALMRLLALSDGQAKGLSANQVELNLPHLATESETDLHRQLLWQQWMQYQAQRSSLASSLEKIRAEQAGSKETVSKLEQTAPIVTKRANKLQNLHQQNFVSELDFLETEQERIQMVQDLATEKFRFKQLLAAENEMLEKVRLLSAQTRAGFLAEMTDQKRQLVALNEELNKATDLNAKQVLYAPVDGRVQELAVNTVGGVVTEAQQLMLVVPEEENLEVEVFLDNKDIGFVHQGMPAEIKIHTFPFTKYGVIDAAVTSVSSDAIVDEKRGLIFSMRLKMNRDTILVEGKEIPLIPGMAVTSEVQTGERRIIEFFLAPLLRHGGESLRER